MLSAELELQNPGGLGDGPASLLAQTARRFHSELWIGPASAPERLVDARIPRAIQELRLKPRDRVRVVASGPDEAEALAALVGAVESGLGEALEEPPQITRRQREILALLTTGLTRKQIAQQLGLAEPTVRNHLSRLYKRLGVHDARQAVLKAQRGRLLRQ